MDNYRKLIKQTYKAYNNNIHLRRYLITVYKTNFRNLSKNENIKTFPEKIVQNLIQLIQKYQTYKIQNSQSI